MSMLDFTAFSRQQAERESKATSSDYKPIDATDIDVLCAGEPYKVIASHLGRLKQNSVVNFWTFGRYAMHHVLRYVLTQTGPADVAACTWAISQRAVDDLLNMRKQGLLRSFRLWIDPRVKVRNPVPLDMLQLNWPVAIAPVHAKVTTISNDKWKVSVSGSLNFTTNPQPERGTICTVPHVFEADNKILQDVFNTPAD